ncbi:hypothetical protein KY289_000737 [Solanum tuberosum]|nr:hypothetical protein KY289_000737 [Solanum tuberosum]
MRDRILTKVQATVGFVSGVTTPKLVNRKRIYTPEDIIDDIREFYGVQISYQQAWRAKERALEMIRALRALMRRFDYYRPIVVVDGAHLGGAYKGTFLSASTLDGQVALPLAYGVMDTKNDCSWTWSKNTPSDLFYSMAKAYIKKDFDILMAKVDKVDHRIKEYLEDAGEIASYTNDTLGRRFEEVLIINAFKSSKMKIVPSSGFIFSVYEAGRRYIVCLERKVCSCGRFQLDEIPCAHAIAVLKDKNVTDMYSYCSNYYKSDAIAKTYEISIVPMSDKEDWSVPDNVVAEIVFPPRYKRLAR